MALCTSVRLVTPVLCFICFCPFPLFAEALYPSPVPARFEKVYQHNTPGTEQEGLQQEVQKNTLNHLPGDKNRSFAMAIKNAYEQAFATKGFPVQISLAYIQFVISLKNVSQNQSLVEGKKLALEEKDLILQQGYLIPHYIWPENLSSIDDQTNPFEFPLFEQLAKILPEFEIETTCQQHELSFPRGGSNTMDIESIKKMLKDGKILTIPILKKWISLFNHQTGLIRSEKIQKALHLNLNQRPDQRVALLGFDDDLYQGQGAFIITKGDFDFDPKRELETWGKEGSFLSKILSVETLWENFRQKKPLPDIWDEQKTKQLSLFRDKIDPQNNRDYYAIPYSLIEKSNIWGSKDKSDPYERLMSHPLPPFEQYYKAYQKYEKEFPIYYLPYACDRIKSLKILSLYSDLKGLMIEKKSLEKRSILKATHTRLQAQPSQHVSFGVAQVSNESEVVQFYSNQEKYRKFYCPNEQIYPSLNQIQQLPFYQSILLKRQKGPQEESYWDSFFSELSSLEDSRLYAVPYTYNQEDIMLRLEHLNYFKNLISNQRLPLRVKAASKQYLDHMIRSFMKNPNNSGFYFKFLEKEEEVHAFYLNNSKFNEKSGLDQKIFPTLEVIQNSDFFQKLITQKYKDFRTQRYWNLLFHSLNQDPKKLESKLWPILETDMPASSNE